MVKDNLAVVENTDNLILTSSQYSLLSLMFRQKVFQYLGQSACEIETI